jgi:hypothetical protein
MATTFVQMWVVPWVLWLWMVATKWFLFLGDGPFLSSGAVLLVVPFMDRLHGSGNNDAAFSLFLVAI